MPIMKPMRISKACVIFNHMDSPEYSDEEKALAIKMVLEMPTHNGITKDQILNATRWLWEQCWQIEEAHDGK